MKLKVFWIIKIGHKGSTGFYWSGVEGGQRVGWEGTCRHQARGHQGGGWTNYWEDESCRCKSCNGMMNMPIGKILIGLNLSSFLSNEPRWIYHDAFPSLCWTNQFFIILRVKIHGQCFNLTFLTIVKKQKWNKKSKYLNMIHNIVHLNDDIWCILSSIE